MIRSRYDTAELLVELDEFQQWCEYSMDPKFDEASVDAFERKLAQREKEQKNTYLLR